MDAKFLTDVQYDTNVKIQKISDACHCVNSEFPFNTPCTIALLKHNSSCLFHNPALCHDLDNSYCKYRVSMF